MIEIAYISKLRGVKHCVIGSKVYVFGGYDG